MIGKAYRKLTGEGIKVGDLIEVPAFHHEDYKLHYNMKGRVTSCVYTSYRIIVTDPGQCDYAWCTVEKGKSEWAYGNENPIILEYVEDGQS